MPLKAGHFSVKIPGQVSVEINIVFLLGGRNLKCIGSNVADIVVMSTQALQTFTRHDHPDAVLAWEWPLLKNI